MISDGASMPVTGVCVCVRVVCAGKEDRFLQAGPLFFLFSSGPFFSLPRPLRPAPAPLTQQLVHLAVSAAKGQAQGGDGDGGLEHLCWSLKKEDREAVGGGRKEE